MAFELVGKLVEKYDEVKVSDKFKKREFVVEYKEGNYPEFIKFQLTQDKTDLIEAYQAGEEIKVSFNLRGSKWKEQYFTNLQAWRLEKVSGSSAQGGKSGSENSQSSAQTIDDMPNESTDDLPF